tara:strand:- start:644 stop:1168 length:525 start_codon:yes stop_codon:yes gene_type:complete
MSENITQKISTAIDEISLKKERDHMASNSFILDKNGIINNLKVNSKKQLLQEISTRAEKIYNINPKLSFELLQQRERLGSTGIGNGVAVPHAKLPNLEFTSGLFIRLSNSIDFESVDGLPVDLIFTLFAPHSSSGDHLKALSQISRLLGDEKMRDKIRGTRNTDALYVLLAQFE